jgi:hypothetical protein
MGYGRVRTDDLRIYLDCKQMKIEPTRMQEEWMEEMNKLKGRALVET